MPKPMSMDFVLPQPAAPGPRNSGNASQGVSHRPSPAEGSNGTNKNRSEKDGEVDFRTRLNEAHDAKPKRSDTKVDKPDNGTENNENVASDNSEIATAPDQVATDTKPQGPVESLPEVAGIAPAPESQLTETVKPEGELPETEVVDANIPETQFSDSSSADSALPELETQDTEQYETQQQHTVVFPVNDAADGKVEPQVKPATASVELARGEVLPPSGKPLPAQVEGDKPGLAAEVSSARHDQTSKAGGELPALSRARLDMSPNEVAIREHLESVTRATGGTEAVELPVEEGSDNVKSPLLAVNSASVSASAQPATSPLPDRPALPQTQATRPPEFTLSVPAGEPGWEADMSNRLLWMVERNTPSAVLRLDPPELGALEVRISTEGDKANVTFIAQHGQARDVLESALPKLREMLGQNGIQLADARVSQDSMGNQQGNDAFAAASERTAGNSVANSGDASVVEMPLVRRESGSGLVDYYI